jgi:hypothetical protein
MVEIKTEQSEIGEHGTQYNAYFFLNGKEVTSAWSVYSQEEANRKLAEKIGELFAAEQKKVRIRYPIRGRRPKILE